MKDKLAIIVPYRDREEHLNVFVPHMHSFLKDKGIDYTIFIAEQSDDRPFNYGKLCNVVTREIDEEYTYFAFHDIDMLPINDDCDYGYPDSPTHLATNVEAHENKLPYPQYFGGVVLINREDFENANGYSNEYWGYGFEDLDLLYRLQTSEAYLEKFYDLNQTYERYDDTDILPYRIEDVRLTNKLKNHNIHGICLDKTESLKGRMTSILKNTITDSFSISLWFKDSGEIKNKKNLFSFEGMDSGLFLDRGNYVISQIWDNGGKSYDVSFDYKRNKWNHLVYRFDNVNKELSLFCNNKLNKIKLPNTFEIHPHYIYSTISDNNSEISIASIITFNDSINEDIVGELFYNGFKTLDLIQNKYGIQCINLYDFKSNYSNNLLLDNGTSRTHLQFTNKLNNITEKIETTSVVYLPIRLNGKYKSLVHDGDTNIISKYYKYDPDIEENADIFFHDVITDNLDINQTGLSTLQYKLLDKQNREGYELVRIIT